MTSMQESPTGSTEGEVLRQWDQRIHDAGDPLAALAELLTSRQAARSRLFDLAGSTMLGCKLQRMLGAGGMGVTYAGLAPDGTPVAVKLVAGVAQTTGERFEQECRLLQSLRHEAIVRYRDHEVQADGTGVLVMDRVDGIELELLLAKVAAPTASDLEQIQPLAMLFREVDLQAHQMRGEDVRSSPRYRRRMMRLLAEVADGLHAAHEEGVIHRDVKPANILVRDDLTPVLIDFGLARDLRNKVSFTHSGVAMGTLAYMAPEQLGRDPGAVDRRADVYAIGLILFRALMGAELRQEVGDVLTSGARSFLLDGRASRALPVGVQAILYSCLDPRPERRYATAADLAADLRAAAGDGLVRAQRPNAVSRVLRDRRKVAAGVAMLLIAVSLMAWQLWPHGRYVQFVSNCRAEDATVVIDGNERAWLLDPVWLPYGEHTVRLKSERVGRVEAAFTVSEMKGTQWVALVTHYLHELHPAYKNGEVPVLFSTGHSWAQMAPGVPRDRRLINEREVLGLGPVDVETMVAPGDVTLRAIDGKGREETQRVRVGNGAVDVQLLPGWMSDIDGTYRRTWSTVLSPRMPDLELTTDAETWVGSARETMFGHGTRPVPCGLAPAIADQRVRVRLRVLFPEPMMSAVVLARAFKRPGGQLEVDVAFEGQESQVWPVLADGSLQQRVALRADRPARWLEVRATLSAEAAPSTSLALAQMFAGVHSGGHWRDEPPCFAIVADPADAARLPDTKDASQFESVPRWQSEATLGAYPPRSASPRVRRGPGGKAQLLVPTFDRKTDRGAVAVLSWPAAQEEARITASVLSERNHKGDGGAFADVIVVRDADGDGWEDIVVGDSSSERAGRPFAGAVARLEGAGLTPRWIWQAAASAAPMGDDVWFLVSACGDWSGDGHEDLLACSENYWVDERTPKSGAVAVIDGLTGAELWWTKGARPFGRKGVFGSHGDPQLPHVLLLQSRWAVADNDAGSAVAYSLWLGGKDGRETAAVTVSGNSMGIVVPSISGEGPVDLVMYRFGPWQDGFTGFERYEIRGGELHLAQQRRMSLPPLTDYNRNRKDAAALVSDLDGDGVRDIACINLSCVPSLGVLFVSGATLLPIARAQLPTLSSSAGAWIPAVADAPAQLFVIASDTSYKSEWLRIVPPSSPR